MFPRHREASSRLNNITYSLIKINNNSREINQIKTKALQIKDLDKELKARQIKLSDVNLIQKKLANKLAKLNYKYMGKKISLADAEILARTIALDLADFTRDQTKYNAEWYKKYGMPTNATFGTDRFLQYSTVLGQNIDNILYNMFK